MTDTEKRYFFGSDNSGHHYLVDAEHRAEWNAWCDLDEDDEASWEAPAFARRLNIHDSNITFTDPRPYDPTYADSWLLPAEEPDR